NAGARRHTCGLKRVTEVEAAWEGSAQLFDPSVDGGTLVRKERRVTDTGSEQSYRTGAAVKRPVGDAEPLDRWVSPAGGESHRGPRDRTGVSSLRRAAR